METLPNRSRYQSFAVKVYVVAVVVAVAVVAVEDAVHYRCRAGAGLVGVLGA